METDHNQTWRYYNYNTELHFILFILLYFERQINTETYTLEYSVYDKCTAGVLERARDRSVTLCSVCFRAEAYAEKSEFILPFSLLLCFFTLVTSV